MHLHHSSDKYPIIVDDFTMRHVALDSILGQSAHIGYNNGPILGSVKKQHLRAVMMKLSLELISLI